MVRPVEKRLKQSIDRSADGHRAKIAFSLIQLHVESSRNRSTEVGRPVYLRTRGVNLHSLSSSSVSSAGWIMVRPVEKRLKQIIDRSFWLISHSEHILDRSRRIDVGSILLECIWGLGNTDYPSSLLLDGGHSSIHPRKLFRPLLISLLLG